MHMMCKEDTGALKLGHLPLMTLLQSSILLDIANTQIKSFFARIFGIDGFDGSAKAVAYIGFAGDLARWEIDQPIAICAESLVKELDCLDGNNLKDCTLVCNEGRMLDSGTDKPWQDATHNTAAWTNFTQNPCDTADARTMKELVCSECPQDDPDCRTLKSKLLDR